MNKKRFSRLLGAVSAFLIPFVLSLPVLSEATSDKRLNIALLRMELPRDFYDNEQFSLANDFLSALYATHKFVIVDRKDMDHIIQELKFQASDLVDQEEVVELGALLGVDFFVTCNIRPVKGTYQITSQLINVEKAKIEKIIVKRCDNKFDYIPALFNDIAYDLAGMEAEKGQLRIETDPPQAEVFLFGISKGYSPAVLHLAPGFYLVSVEKKGYKVKRTALAVESNTKSDWKPVLYKKKRVRLGEYIGGKSFWGEE